MNNRQKRLCRALLDFYDESGAQPYPLAQLAKKTGYDPSDVYDKDSQSGDLWPFDPKARGNLAGLLTFTSGKNPTVGITSAGVVTLEKLCGDSPEIASPEKIVDVPVPVRAPAPAPVPTKPKVATERPFPIKPAAVTEKPFPATPPPRAPTAKPFPVSAKPFPVAPKRVSPVAKILPSNNLASARARFKGWLEFDPEGKALLEHTTGIELVESAFDKFFGEFLQDKDS